MNPRRLATTTVTSVVLLAVLLSGCGRQEPTPVAESGGAAASGPPPTPSSTKPTAPPGPKLKSTPACVAFSRFKLTQLGVSTARPEDRDRLIEVMNQQANDTRAQLPQFAEAINQQVLTLRKTIAGTVTDEDKAKNQQAQDQLGAWYQQTCLEDPTGATTTAPTSTAAPAKSTTTVAPPKTTTTTKR
ncbi:MAG: hypothetical protein U0Q07_19365 [Acidimicrobiales bacterium]